MLLRSILTLAVLGLVAVPASAQDMLLIPESSNDSVQKFDPTTGAHLGDAVPSDATNLSTPIDCALNSSGILVSDQLEDGAVQYALDGTYISTPITGVDNTRGMAAQGGTLYMTAGNADAVPSFDLETGASLGDFIAAGAGGLDSPFDVLFRTNDVLVTSINSDEILSYDHAGVPLGVFASGILFGEQMCGAANGNVLVADFSRNEIVELDPTGIEVGAYAVSGPRGCYELPNGNVLTSNGAGVHEVARPGGGIVDTKLASVSARFIEHILLGATPVESTTWGQIKNRFK